MSSVLGRLNFPFLISWVLLLSRTKTIEAFTNFKFEAKKSWKIFSEIHTFEVKTFVRRNLCAQEPIA